METRSCKHISKLVLVCTFILCCERAVAQNYSFDFYGDTFNFNLDESANRPFPDSVSSGLVGKFYTDLNKSNFEPLVTALNTHKNKYKLNDWLYYQLVRKTAQQIAPKAKNYYRYTLYKWFLLAKTGYDVKLALERDKLLFYVLTNDDISDIPFYVSGNKKYVCLNIHDYPDIDLAKNKIFPIDISVHEAEQAFSYKITQMPYFEAESYLTKNLQFRYRQKVYHFEVKLTPDVQTIFKNYPVVDFASYFNIPLSSYTYSSLIPSLKRNIAGMNQKRGIDYLMRFTRNAFLYEDDELNFGKEKRLTPEQTLFSEYSDCDDRVALFFYLVKEIYNLPMIALLYPTHITIAVQFDKAAGKPIIYNGKKYYVCEATPQKQDLKIGQIASDLKAVAYEVIYAYHP